MDKHIFETLLCDITLEQINSFTAKQLISVYMGTLIFSAAFSYRINCELNKTSTIDQLKELDEDVDVITGDILDGIKQICEFKNVKFEEIF